MNIALLQPPTPQSEDETLLGTYPPIGLAWLAGNVCRKKHNIKVYDMRLSPLKIDKWDIVGITCQTVSLATCKAVVNGVRDELPDVIIVAGGHHPIPDDLLEFSDYVVRGEGEITFNNLLQRIEKGNTMKVKGVTSLCNHNPDRPHADLKQLNPPAYKYISLKDYHPNEGAIVTSRGCPYHCLFCISPFGHTWRGRTPSQVVAEAQELIKGGAHTLHIMDDLFTFDRERVLCICEGFASLDVRWDLPNGTRADTVDHEMLDKMAESGCTRILYGIESGVQEILTAIRKGITLDCIKKTVLSTKKSGIEVEGLFMVGNPGDTPETVRRTVEFVKDLDITGHFSLATPYPGTDFWKWVTHHGTFLDIPYHKFEQVPVFETAQFSAQDRLEMLQWASDQCR